MSDARQRRTSGSEGAKPKRPLKLGYYAQNPALAGALFAWDILCRLLPVRRGPLGREVRRVLIANWGHLGDALIAASLVPLLHGSRPEVEIGFLVGSWGRATVECVAGIRWLHTVDHWRLSRRTASLGSKVGKYLRDRQAALREIRSVGYDAAIESYSFFPTCASLLWQSGIPRRIGYTTGGGGPLFTDPVPWVPADRHIATYHRDLLIALLGPAAAIPPASMPEISSRPTEIAEEIAPNLPYVVVHMGAGSPLKEWPEGKWADLVKALISDGNQLVFTGRGEREAAAIERVCRSAGAGVNLSDRLGWNDWVELIRGAQMVVGVDSSAGHIAAATHTPAVLIYSGMTNNAQWRPLADNCEILRHPTPCAPCYRSTGCSTMACVRQVEVRQVLEVCRRVLGSRVPSPQRA